MQTLTHTVHRTDHTGRGVALYMADSLEHAFEAVAPLMRAWPGGTLNPRPGFYIASRRADSTFAITYVGA